MRGPRAGLGVAGGRTSYPAAHFLKSLAGAESSPPRHFFAGTETEGPHPPHNGTWHDRRSAACVSRTPPTLQRSPPPPRASRIDGEGGLGVGCSPRAGPPQRLDLCKAVLAAFCRTLEVGSAEEKRSALEQVAARKVTVKKCWTLKAIFSRAVRFCNFTEATRNDDGGFDHGDPRPFLF